MQPKLLEGCHWLVPRSSFCVNHDKIMPCSDWFCPGEIFPGGAIAPPAPPSPTSMMQRVVGLGSFDILSTAIESSYMYTLA